MATSATLSDEYEVERPDRPPARWSSSAVRVKVPLWPQLLYRDGTIRDVDINVKNLDPDIVSRLAEQALAEGMSQQEWIRQTLRRSTARLSPAELLRRREMTEPMKDEEFSEIRQRAAKRRKAAVENLDARQRRR